MSRWRILSAATLVVVLVPLPEPASAATFVQPAAAPAVAPLQVTMVARSCQKYTDIFANRARNDIMESLQDLGPDTPYGSSFTAITPSVEDGLAPQSACTPLPNWTFTFGNGIGRPVPGTNLSFVTNPARQVTTQATTALLDPRGAPTGQQIAGATTFTLNQTEAGLASQNSRLWVMGGTTSEPLNGRESEYAFGALRCARDNLNGDNVEWVGYPSGQTHVFCYAFYVTPPPGAGRIIIEKQLLAPITRAPFDFTGNLSFNEGGRFTLTPNGSGGVARTEFIRSETRAGEDPWVVTESGTDGFVLTDLSCTSDNDLSDVVIAASTATITLAEGDTVVCRFVNDLAPPPTGQGRIIKFVVGPDTGIPASVLPTNWTFPFIRPDVTSGQLDIPATLDNPSADTGVISGLTAGVWTVTEKLPAPTAGWRWEFESGFCQDSSGISVIAVDPGTGLATGSATIDPEDQEGATCLFGNRLVPTGGLRINLTTRGGTGTFGFIVAGAEDGSNVAPPPPVDRVEAIGGNGGVTLAQNATTTAADTRVLATGDSTDPLIGSWFVTPIRPPDSAAGRWVIEGLPSCNVSGAPALNIGPEILKVAPGNLVSPVITCDYVYRLVPPSSLDLVKVIAGDRSGQTGTVAITATCSDGSSARLEVAPGASTPARLPTPLTFVDPVTCQVAEVSTGVAPGFSVDTATQVTSNGQLVTRDLLTLTIGGPSTSEAVVVQYTNTYRGPTVQPPPVTTIPPTLPPTIPPTGATPMTAWLAWGALVLVALGLATVVIGRRFSATAPGR